VFKRVARLTVPGATAATWSAARAVRDGLTQHGFEVSLAPGFASKREMTVARFVPRHVPTRPGAYRPSPVGPREALIIGGGLAGCAAAWALCQQGWHSTVLDSLPEPAMATSGNPGGLMHGIFNAPDGLHARWFRTAALHTARWAAPAMADGQVPGQLAGLLRLEAALDTPAGLAAAQARFDQVGLDPQYLDRLLPETAARLAGLPLPHGAWHYPQAGWLSPQAWARWLLAGAQAHWQGRAAVHQLRRVGAHWQALDPQGQVLAEAPVLVLAHALGARQLWPADLAALPLQAVRGQTTVLPGDTPGLRRPARPVSGHGYALSLPSGDVLVGATSQPEDDEPALRAADQQHNLQRACELGVIDGVPALPLTGRVGWRATAPDRLPLIGPPVDAAALAVARAGRQRLDALRHLPRWHDADQGVYVFTALGSRGITSAALGARVLAAWITGAPMPVEAALRDALDPARLAQVRTTS
jgi:tRNA 5-methylaminomethyl-2-thiouridine biosynthesis bifunctional protein